MEEKRRKELQTSVREILNTKKKASGGGFKEGEKSSGTYDSGEEDDADFDAAMRRQVLEKRKKFDEGHGSMKHSGRGMPRSHLSLHSCGPCHLDWDIPLI